ncbi:TetR/AcrR family transcriptional regulator [Nocardia goodfellowii]|uniref:AcrR family transcriptional regulator n=1 Tax=Nocardia goodfellowii TaxID=882446 RepID=A0ABS4QTN0_9NOCA|nr:TetR/AcrR family transcriptional regulator [Nocardia goodfellowii]MBP2193961.1 AcrR family transcriptional regulator [Nocardia goodfellowii]
MTKGSRRAYRTGLAPGVIVDAALALTAERGLDGWSMRDLTGRLDTSLSVIYHHVGDRQRVCAAVIDRIFGAIDMRLDEPDWRQLLHGILSQVIDHLSGYPGTATWLLRNGPQTERLLPSLDAGMTRMLEAGWGSEAAIAFSVAFNTCLGLIALGDQRASEAGEQGMAGLQGLLEAHPDAGPGAQEMLRMVRQYVGSPRDRDAAHREQCRYALARMLDGMAARLEVIKAAPL